MTTLTPDQIEMIDHAHAAGLSVQGDVGKLLRHIEGEQSRIDAAVAKGFRAGIEKAAQWHEYRAAAHGRDAIRDARGQWSNGPALSEDAHRRYAAAMRALIPTPTTEEGA